MTEQSENNQAVQLPAAAEESSLPTPLPLPPIIDDELAALIAKRGVDELNRMIRVRTVAFTVCFFAIGAANMFFGVPWLPLFGAWVAVLIAVAAAFTAPVESAFRQRRYDDVIALLPRAQNWNWFWYPFTHIQTCACDRALNDVLNGQGRYAEFETVTRLGWAMTEKKPVWTGVPKNWIIANNLAVSMIHQLQFEQAANILEELVKKSEREHKVTRLFLLTNLSSCLVRLDRLDESAKYLEAAEKLNGGETNTLITGIMQLVRGSLESKRNNLDVAEEFIHKTQQTIKAIKAPIELSAWCEEQLGVIRHKQKRYDEADLYFRNAISIFESSPHVSYLDMMRVLQRYSLMLDAAGKSDEAQAARERANSCINLYHEREHAITEKIRQRLKDPRRIQSSAELVVDSTKRLPGH